MAEERVMNWGRWGKEDQLGAANLITPERMVQAARLVKRGKLYSLSSPIREDKVPRMDIRPGNQHFVRIFGGPQQQSYAEVADDTLLIGCHGTSTHIDALCHYWTEGTMYNGFPAKKYVEGFGATKLGITNVKGIFSRGVLLDLAGMKGKPYLEGAYAITPQDLEDCCMRQGTRIEPGDAVLFRTGWNTVYYSQGFDVYNHSQPGLEIEAGLWLAKKDVSVVGADNSAIGVRDKTRPPRRNVHDVFLQDAGIYLIEMMDLEQLAADKVYEFLFVASPLQVTGGTGSSLNPLAIV